MSGQDLNLAKLFQDIVENPLHTPKAQETLETYIREANWTDEERQVIELSAAALDKAVNDNDPVVPDTVVHSISIAPNSPGITVNEDGSCVSLENVLAVVLHGEVPKETTVSVRGFLEHYKESDEFSGRMLLEETEELPKVFFDLAVPALAQDNNQKICLTSSDNGSFGYSINQASFYGHFISQIFDKAKCQKNFTDRACVTFTGTLDVGPDGGGLILTGEVL